MTYLRMILFFLSFFGINLFIENNKIVNKKITLPISIAIITIILYIFSIIKLLKIGFILLFILGISFLLYFIIKKRINYKSYLTTENTLLFIFFIYCLFITKNMHYTHLDNYSHWGLIIHLIVENLNLPTNMDVLSFAYPPGTALFISFFSYTCGNTSDGIFIVAQNLIIICFLKGIANLIDASNNRTKTIIFILLYLFMQTYLVSFNDLLVDSVIPLVSVFTVFIIYTSKKEDNIFVAIIFLSVFLYLIKNVGLILSLLIIFIYYFKKNNLKHLIVMLVTLSLTYLSWNIFISQYGEMLNYTMHLFTPNYLIKTFLEKGSKYCLNYYLKYLLIIFNFKDYYSNLMYLIINIFLIINMFLSKKKNIGLFIKLNVIYLLYFIGLGFMYVFSMSLEEAAIYACYDRYMMFPILIIIFIIAFVLLKHNNKNQLIIVILFLLFSLLFKVNSLKPLIGIDDYHKSRMYKYDQIIKDYDLKGKSIGIYSDGSGEGAFLEYYSYYKLRTRRFTMLYNNIPDDYYDVIIVFDSIDSIEDVLIKKGYKRYRNSLFAFQ